MPSAHAVDASSPAPSVSAQQEVTSSGFLNRLGTLTPREAVAMVTRPEGVHDVLLEPPSARHTEVWWSGLDEHERRNLTSAVPEVIGNLPGIPFGVRDQANRYYLSQTIDQLEDRIEAGVGRGAGTEVHAQLGMLRQVEHALGAKTQTPRTLMSLDTAWPGRAAIVVGDIVTADYVSYLVPGMFFTIEGQVGDWTDTATALQATQTDWLDRLKTTDPALEGRTAATVAWMGYETPNIFSVGSEELADEGALYLTSAMDALFGERGPDRPFVSVLAHSYGSTTAMKALTTGAFEVDAFAIVGSPGSSAQSVDDLHVKNREVYVGEASWDPVVGTGFFGSNPGAPAYGAQRMSVAGGTDAITHEALTPSVGHNSYFAAGSESLRNMALIGIDHGFLASESADSSKTVALKRRLDSNAPVR